MGSLTSNANLYCKNQLSKLRQQLSIIITLSETLNKSEKYAFADYIIF